MSNYAATSRAAALALIDEGNALEEQGRTDLDSKAR